MEVGVVVFGGSLLPRCVVWLLIRSLRIPIWSSFKVSVDCCGCVCFLSRGRCRLVHRVLSSGGPLLASTASSPSSHFTSLLPPEIKVAQVGSLVQSRCDHGYGVKVHESAHERWDLAPISHFSTQSDVVMPMWWRCWMSGCGSAIHHRALCLATMVVAESSVVLVWEDYIAVIEVNSSIIQMQVRNNGVPHGYIQVLSNVRLDGFMWTLVLLQLHLWWRICVCRSTSISSSSMVYCYLSGCDVLYSFQPAVHDERFCCGFSDLTVKNHLN